MKCMYCGEREASVQIINPNISWDEKTIFWDVCADCKEIISNQQLLSFGFMLNRKADSKSLKELGQKIMDNAQYKIDVISQESGLPVFSGVIKKKEEEK